MRFFFDRCVPINIARMVGGVEAGRAITILPHDDDPRFTNTTPDVEWMEALRSDGDPPWIIISGDGRILRNKAERDVLDEVELRMFCLVPPWPNLPLYECAWKFMKVWPDILALARGTKGRIFEVRAGKTLKVEIVS